MKENKSKKIGTQVIIVWIIIIALFSIKTFAQEGNLKLKDSVSSTSIGKITGELVYSINKLRQKTEVENWIEQGVLCYQSDKRFATLYKVEYGDRNFYTDFIIIVRREFLIFSEYKRDGTLKESYRLPINKLRVYKSKE